MGIFLCPKIKILKQKTRFGSPKVSITCIVKTISVYSKPGSLNYILCGQSESNYPKLSVHIDIIPNCSLPICVLNALEDDIFLFQIYSEPRTFCLEFKCVVLVYFRLFANLKRCLRLIALILSLAVLGIFVQHAALTKTNNCSIIRVRSKSQESGWKYAKRSAVFIQKCH